MPAPSFTARPWWLLPVGRVHPLDPFRWRARAFARRSIVARRDIAAGQLLTPELVTCKRPGTGIPAARWHEVLGQRAARDLDEDQVLAWSDLAPAEG